MTSVADAYMYDDSDNLLATAKTLMDSSVEVTLSNTDVRGGKGNPLQYILFNGPEMNLTLTDTQFNIDFLAQTLGATLGTGVNVFSEEDVTLGAGGTGTVTGTPLAYTVTTVYGWVTHSDATVERVTFSGSNFTSASGSENDVVCVRYYNLDSAARQVSVNANIIPNIVRVELEAQLANSESSTNVVGKVVFTIPQLSLSGAFALSMTPDGVSNTPLTGRALSYTPTSGSCANQDVLGYITRVIDSANWYDTVVAMAIVGGDIALTHPTTHTVVAKAIHSDGSVSTPPPADLTFASATGATATIGANTGLITTVATGNSLISVYPTSAPAYDASVTLTVS